MGLNDRDMEGWIPVPIRIDDFILLPDGRPKHGVDKTRPSFSPDPLRQLDRLVDRSRRRSSRQEKDLIEPQAQDIESSWLDSFKRNFRKMLNYPIELSSPTEDTISQFREKGSIKGGQISVAFEGVGEKTIGMGMGPLQPI